MRAGWCAFAAALSLVVAVPAHAQQSQRAQQGRPPRPAPKPPSQSVPRPQVPQAPAPSQLPSPAALSVPDPLAGFRPGPRDLYQLPGGYDRFQHLRRHHAGLPVVLIPGGGFYTGYGPMYDNYGRPLDYGRSYDYPYQYEYVEHYPQQRFELRGALTLVTVPDKAQVYVDGFYVGLAEDFGVSGRPLDLAAGSHRVELRAPDYETLSFSVMIEPNQIVRYRGDMQRPASFRAPVAVAPGPAAADANRAQLLRHPQVLRRRQAADRPAPCGMRRQKHSKAELNFIGSWSGSWVRGFVRVRGFVHPAHIEGATNEGARTYEPTNLRTHEPTNPRTHNRVVHSRSLKANSALPAVIDTYCFPFTA